LVAGAAGAGVISSTFGAGGTVEDGTGYRLRRGVVGDFDELDAVVRRSVTHGFGLLVRDVGPGGGDDQTIDAGLKCVDGPRGREPCHAWVLSWA
jgi:hypothetical protein